MTARPIPRLAALERRARLAIGRRIIGDREMTAIATARGPTVREVQAEACAKVERMCGGVVAYGPFEGLRLPAASGWNGLDRAALLLGLYEKELLDRLAATFATPAPFVDVGGADGYYCVGALVAGWCPRAVTFEASAERRALIAETAALNGVADRLTILGSADATLCDEVRCALDAPPAAARYLIDIEGGEYGLLTAPVLAQLAGATLFVEIHKWADPTGSERAALLGRADAFAVAPFASGPRDLGLYPELDDFSDDERWLICSERRRLPGLWWQLVGRDDGAAR